MTPQVRRIRAHEADRMRTLRLHALADSPMAFSSTLAREQAFSDDMWRERAASASAGCELATFIAEQDGQWVGTVTGRREADADGGWLVVAMFVDPAARRLGLGVALIEAVSAWARDCGAERVSLWVAQGNDPALSLYHRLGFQLTGVSKPHPIRPPCWIGRWRGSWGKGEPFFRTGGPIGRKTCNERVVRRVSTWRTCTIHRPGIHDLSVACRDPHRALGYSLRIRGSC